MLDLSLITREDKSHPAVTSVRHNGDTNTKSHGPAITGHRTFALRRGSCSCYSARKEEHPDDNIRSVVRQVDCWAKECFALVEKSPCKVAAR